jgi:hypothetical protein
MSNTVGEQTEMSTFLTKMKNGYEEYISNGAELNEFERSRYLFVKSLLRMIGKGTIKSLKPDT